MSDMTAEANWLQNLKAGDEVCVKSHYGATIHRVEKITAKQIALRHLRFGRKNGERIGGDRWISQWLAPVNDEIRLQVEKRYLVNHLSSLDRFMLEKLPIEMLRQANELLKAKDAPWPPKSSC